MSRDARGAREYIDDRPALNASIQEEAITQTLTQASDDYAEMKSARAEQRDPVYRGR